MLKVRKILVLSLLSVVILGASARSISDEWTVTMKSIKEQVIAAHLESSLYRGTVLAKSNTEEIELKFSAVALENSINLLTVKNLKGEQQEPQLNYDKETKEFYHGKRKNRVSRSVRSDSTNETVILSGIEIWLELQDN